MAQLLREAVSKKREREESESRARAEAKRARDANVEKAIQSWAGIIDADPELKRRAEADGTADRVFPRVMSGEPVEGADAKFLQDLVVTAASIERSVNGMNEANASLESENAKRMKTRLDQLEKENAAFRAASGGRPQQQVVTVAAQQQQQPQQPQQPVPPTATYSYWSKQRTAGTGASAPPPKLDASAPAAAAAAAASSMVVGASAGLGGHKRAFEESSAREVPRQPYFYDRCGPMQQLPEEVFPLNSFGQPHRLTLIGASVTAGREPRKVQLPDNIERIVRFVGATMAAEAGESPNHSRHDHPANTEMLEPTLGYTIPELIPAMRGNLVCATQFYASEETQAGMKKWFDAKGPQPFGGFTGHWDGPVA